MVKTKQKKTIFKVDVEAGTKFSSIAALLDVEREELLLDLMVAYIQSVQSEIVGVAEKFPTFAK